MVRRYDCPFCPSTFARSDTRSRHINRMHGAVPPVYPCIICGFNFNTVQELHLHIEGHAPQVDYERVEAADGGGHIYRKYYVPATASLELTLGRDHATLCDILAHEAVTKRYAKCSITVMAEFVKVTPDGLVDRSVTIYLKSKTFALTLYQDYEYFIRRCHAEIVVNAEDMVQNGSDWILHAVHRTEMLVAKCNPLQGACGQLPVSMPRDILNFRQVTADDDRACFFRCIARHFVDSDDEAVLNGWIRANLDTGSFQLPFRVDKIADFEGRHSATLNFKINVIYKEGEDIYPIFASRNTVAEEHINILLYHQTVPGADGDVETVEAHYAHIADLGKLLRSTYRTEATGRKSYSRCHVCPNCLNRFSNSRARDEHFALCKRNECQRVKVPEPGTELKFRNHCKRFRIPICGFFDFESLQQTAEQTCTPACVDPSVCHHRSYIETHQKAGTYSLVLIDWQDNIVHSHTYSGDDCAENLVDHLLDIEPDLMVMLEAEEEMVLSPAEERSFVLATTCHICGEALGWDRKRKRRDAVRDHCHLSGQFLGAAHNKCNLQRRVVKRIPLYAHNFSNYDSHLVLTAIRKDERITKLQCLPRNQEKVRNLILNRYHFTDSMSFLDGSLAQVVDDLARSGHDFDLLQKSGLCSTDEEKQLLLRKGIYPYEAAISTKQLMEETDIPPIEAFFSKVSNSTVTQEEYEHARNVFRTFRCPSLLAYTQLYCRLDTILLASAFLSFREEVLLEFDLDACHYISLPQLAYDCMFKLTRVRIECLSDIDQILFLEAGIRGGVSFIGRRHVERSTGPDDPAATRYPHSSSFCRLLYIDMNNLYGYGQIQKMPIGDYRWMTRQEMDARDWARYDENEVTDYVVSVTLRYPSHLHLAHNSLPLAPHFMNIDQDNLSPFMRQVLRENRGTDKHESKKLVSTFLPREEYTCHAYNLSLYLGLGMELVKVHKALQFTTSRFLERYINYCTTKRQQATSDFRKRLFKAFSNSNFGKFIENTRDHMDCKLVTTRGEMCKLVTCPRYISFKKISDDLTAVFLRQRSVNMRQAWGIGLTILERSKGLIYEHYYNRIKPALDGKVAVAMTDTDSLVLICTGGLTQDQIYEKLGDLLDTSNFSKSHRLYNPTRMNQLTFWKDEMRGDDIRAFAGCASKSYAIDIDVVDETSQVRLRGRQETKAKGVSRGIRKTIPYRQWECAVLNKIEYRVTQYNIMAKNHQIYTLAADKLALSPLDDKRYVNLCGVHTVPYGSKFIPVMERLQRCIFCKQPNQDQ